MTEPSMHYPPPFGREPDAPTTGCVSCLCLYAEYQRIALLFERLAEDRFPDQETFDEWCRAQSRQIFKRR